jgi:pimeloyl-ACP methyl ester carboxylesterase
MTSPIDTYHAIRQSTSHFVDIRGLRYHVREWPANVESAAPHPPLVMLHGFMDVAASFQFLVDALPGDRTVFALDWRGFGLTESPAVDSYWFPDYLGDLDAVLDHFSPGAPVDLLGHSMGGNIAMMYAGVRANRVRKLINLEGFGLPEPAASDAPRRMAKWLDQLKIPQRMRSYQSLQAVADRLQQNNARLTADKARWLAAHWSREATDGQWHLLCDPAHKRVNPILYREAEALACRQQTTAPILWVEGAQTNLLNLYGGRYPREEWDRRLAALPHVEREVLEDCGHMLHHDQPGPLAARINTFLQA